jgi:hypothetical protein
MTRLGSFPSGVLGALTDSRLFEQKEFKPMRTTLDIYSMTEHHNSVLFSTEKTQPLYGENFCSLNSQKLNSNSELILTQLRLEAIDAELAITCSLYSQRCQEFDRITWQTEQYSDCSLELESQETYQEILAIIDKISHLQLERINTCDQLNDLSLNEE